MKKRIPWGIFAGIFAMVVFFATVIIIIAFVALNYEAYQTGNSITIFENWYQVVLFVVDVIAVLGLVGSLVMYGKRTKDERKQKGGA